MNKKKIVAVIVSLCSLIGFGTTTSAYAAGPSTETMHTDIMATNRENYYPNPGQRGEFVDGNVEFTLVEAPARQGHPYAVITGFRDDGGHHMVVLSEVLATVNGVRKAYRIDRIGNGTPIAITGTLNKLTVSPRTEIADQAFRGNKTLKEVDLRGTGDTIIRPFAFAETPNLATIDFCPDYTPSAYGEETLAIKIMEAAFYKAGTKVGGNNTLNLWSEGRQGHADIFHECCSSYTLWGKDIFTGSNITVHGYRYTSDIPPRTAVDPSRDQLIW